MPLPGRWIYAAISFNDDNRLYFCELFILWSTFGPWIIYSMEYLWTLNYLFYGEPLGLELFILWSTFGPWMIYAMEYLWSLNYFQEYFWALNFHSMESHWALNYLFYGEPLGLELFILWITFGPWIIYSMEYLWALNDLCYGVPLVFELFSGVLLGFEFLFYGVPLGPELFILWSTFGPCPGPCWRGSVVQRWTPGCRTAPWWGSLGTRAHLHQAIYTFFCDDKYELHNCE